MSSTEASGNGNTELIEIWRGNGELEAQLIRSVLECNGIECMFKGEALRLIYGITVNGLGEVKILVRAEDAERARKLLAASENMVECPNCGKPIQTEDRVCPSCRARFKK